MRLTSGSGLTSPPEIPCGVIRRYGRSSETMIRHHTYRGLKFAVAESNSLNKTCSHGSCEKPVDYNGLCGAHVQRMRVGSDMDRPIRPYDPSRICLEDGCDRGHKARGYCASHYTTRRRRGEFGEVRFRQCEQPDCYNQHVAHGLCDLHYQRLRSGTPLDYDRNSPFKIRSIQAVHILVRKTWGKASQYPCIECGESAAHWAYDGTDPTQYLEKVSNSFIWYSQYPEFYMPMCAKCHPRRDRAKAAEELREYRQWKFATGLTLADIPGVEPPNG